MLLLLVNNTVEAAFSFYLPKWKLFFKAAPANGHNLSSCLYTALLFYLPCIVHSVCTQIKHFQQHRFKYYMAIVSSFHSITPIVKPRTLSKLNHCSSQEPNGEKKKKEVSILDVGEKPQRITSGSN